MKTLAKYFGLAVGP